MKNENVILISPFTLKMLLNINLHERGACEDCERLGMNLFSCVCSSLILIVSSSVVHYTNCAICHKHRVLRRKWDRNIAEEQLLIELECGITCPQNPDGRLNGRQCRLFKIIACSPRRIHNFNCV